MANSDEMRGLNEDNHSQSRRSSNLVDRIKGLPQETVKRYQRLSQRNKTIFWAILALHVIIFLLVVIITPTRIGRWFNSFAEYIRDMGTLGIFITAGIVVLTSHPPLFGFSASMTLIGFAYGFWPGALIAAIASQGGAALAFLSVRRFFPGIIRSNAQWDAFGRVMKEKGTVLVCMIRWCPMPWAIGNGLFASIESVTFPQFLLASFLYLPKLLIPVFIGSRLTSLADPDAKHDSVHTWLNIISIGLSVFFSAFAGIWIYRLTLAQMRKYEGGQGEDAADALEGLEEGLLAGYRDETCGEEEARNLTRIMSNGTESSGGTIRPEGVKRRVSGGIETVRP